MPTSILDQEKAAEEKVQKIEAVLQRKFNLAAQKKGNAEALRILDLAKDPVIRSMFKNAGTGTSKIINYIDEKTGLSALHWSIVNADEDLSRSIIEAKSKEGLRVEIDIKSKSLNIGRLDKDLRGYAGKSPLYFTTMFGSETQAELLVQKGDAEVTPGMWQKAEENDVARGTIHFLRSVANNRPAKENKQSTALMKMNKGLKLLEDKGYTLDN